MTPQLPAAAAVSQLRRFLLPVYCTPPPDLHTDTAAATSRHSDHDSSIISTAAPARTTTPGFAVLCVLTVCIAAFVIVSGLVYVLM